MICLVAKPQSRLVESNVAVEERSAVAVEERSAVAVEEAPAEVAVVEEVEAPAEVAAVKEVEKVVVEPAPETKKAQSKTGHLKGKLFTECPPPLKINFLPSPLKAYSYHASPLNLLFVPPK